MAKEGGLDFTAKNFTNHSVQKTTVWKLKKAGASSCRMIKVWLIHDGLNLDHLHLGKVLSVQKPPEVTTKNSQTLPSLVSAPVSGSFPSLYTLYFRTVMQYLVQQHSYLLLLVSVQCSYDHSQSSTSHHNRDFASFTLILNAHGVCFNNLWLCYYAIVA